MKRIIFCAALLTLPGLAQKTAPDVAADQAENLFYRAFYVEHGEHRPDEAIQLYRKFLAAAPQHEHAGRAARGAIGLLESQGKQEEAAELRAKFAGALAAAGANRGADQRRGDAPGAPGVVVLSAEDKKALEDRVAELNKQLAEAKTSGDEASQTRLARQIGRVERQLRGEAPPGGAEAAGRPGGESRGPGRMRMNFAEMSDADITQRMDQIEQFQGRMLDRLREGGQAERADEVEKKWGELKKLLKDGKKAEAQKVYDEVMSSMGNRRRGGDGGNGGGGGGEGGTGR